MEAERALQQTAKVADQNSNRVSESIGGIGKTAIGVAASLVGVSTVMEGLFRGVRLAADAEAMATTFRVLIGDAELATKTLQELEQFALKTPFAMPELIDGAKQMIAFGAAAEEIVPTMRMLGDISSGLEIPLSDLTYLFGTLKSQGRAFTIDIRQFAMRGIPIYLELAKVMGLVSKNAKQVTPDARLQLDKLIEGGGVNFTMVEKAFKNLTGVGGQFFNLMEERSKTLSGVFNEMKESVDISLREIGKSLVEGLQLGLLVKQVTELTTKFNTWLKGLSAETKKAIFLVTSLILVFVALSAAIAFAGTLATIFSGGLNIWAGLITVVIGATALWANEIGGLEKAWKVVKRAAMDFWNFIGPILPLFIVVLGPVPILLALIATHWREIKAAVEEFYSYARPVLQALWALIKDVAFEIRDRLARYLAYAVVQLKELQGIAGIAWNIITGRGVKTWKELRDGLRDFILDANYAFKNFHTVFELAIWKVLEMFTVLKDDVAHFFKNTIPAVLNYFLTNWKDIFAATMKVGEAFVRNLIELLVKGIASVPDILKGDVDLGKMMGDQFKTFKNELNNIAGGIKPIELPIRKVSDEEKNIHKIIVDMEKAILAGMEAFRAERLKGFLVDDWADVFEDVFDAISDIFSKGVEVPIMPGGGGAVQPAITKADYKKFDVALAHSAEANSRIAEYQTGLPDRDMLAKNLAPSSPAGLATVAVLESIRDILLQQAGMPPVVIGMGEVP
jgi:hypothetical protein